jgi:hypothetical protein
LPRAFTASENGRSKMARAKLLQRAGSAFYSALV